MRVRQQEEKKTGNGTRTKKVRNILLKIVGGSPIKTRNAWTMIGPSVSCFAV
ncbi:hypothetical protein SAMN05661091_4978 [Paenibacillus uliginis N3/975]|uniref:Uncharacterized protein n=1 Tax=Paenibacillus uliginis N3/975 TaxID=1313296 RepID=A0A1X7HQB8_9BACL|nr:hypothetical protein SAMN05661091_4978 [Paenibacillus uliginis N3/975]